MSSLFDTDAVPYGPSIRFVFEEGNSRTFSFLAIAAAATFATLVVSARQLFQYLRKIQSCTPRTLAIVFLAVPPLFAVSSFLGLVSPRGNGLFQLIRTAATVMATFAYFKLIFWHVGGVTSAVSAIVAKLGDEKDHWLTKIPILVPFRLCIPKIKMTGKLLHHCRGMVWQFFWIQPIGSIAKLWLILEKATGQDRDIDAGVVAIQSFEFVSMLAAIYGLLTIFFATRPILRDFQPLAKMICVYAVFIINTLQNSLIPAILANSNPPDVEAEQTSETVWHPSYRVQAWKDFIVCLEMVVLSLFIGKAFPFSDMMEYNLLKGQQLPHLDIDADDYLAHRVEEAAHTLRAVSTIDPEQMAQDRQQEILARSNSTTSSHRGSGFFGLRRRSSNSSSLQINSNGHPSPSVSDLTGGPPLSSSMHDTSSTVTITDADTGLRADPSLPLQFLRARTNSIKHIHALSRIFPMAGESEVEGDVSPRRPAMDRSHSPRLPGKANKTMSIAFDNGKASSSSDPPSNGHHGHQGAQRFRPATVHETNVSEDAIRSVSPLTELTTTETVIDVDPDGADRLDELSSPEDAQSDSDGGDDGSGLDYEISLQTFGNVPAQPSSGSRLSGRKDTVEEDEFAATADVFS
eukprot:TRINITY_DN8738_c0_g1_i3.p1 TRINITY_DN8738_c0_g1~~TRINITY_DN8738_c0_g1_i3.p1  ORF type:complete len:631 (+),score=118.20 TRINITY_DN8738_c0_g1_i3:171-2063(+)